MYLDFVRYFFKASNSHAVHSPFVFEFYNKIFKDKSTHPNFESIEAERHKLLTNNSTIQRQDFGAGTKKNTSEKVSSLAKTSLKPKKWSQFLFRIIKFYNYETIIDLGTSFGVTTSYLAKANSNVQIYTFEGCPETLKIAQTTFQNLDIQNVHCVVGNIDLTLVDTLKKIKQIDLAFFDANHKEEPTIQYFEQCLKLKTENSCFVFDDIYWSQGMKNAWNNVKSHEDVSISIDLFFVGLLFFRRGIRKQHFILK